MAARRAVGTAALSDFLAYACHRGAHAVGAGAHGRHHEDPDDAVVLMRASASSAAILCAGLALRTLGGRAAAAICPYTPVAYWVLVSVAHPLWMHDYAGASPAFVPSLMAKFIEARRLAHRAHHADPTVHFGALTGAWDALLATDAARKTDHASFVRGASTKQM